MTDTCFLYLYFIGFICCVTAFLALIWWEGIFLFFGAICFWFFTAKVQQMTNQENNNTNTK